MKKATKIITLIILLFVVWVSVDRYMNIKSTPYNNDAYSVRINDSTWVKIPNEQWIEIEHDKFKPYQAFLNVEGYNFLLNTWDNTVTSHISYAYKNTGEADSRRIYITEYVKPYEHYDIHEITFEDTIDNVQIIFGKIGNNEHVLQLTKNDKTVCIQFYKDDINQLKPLFESIWEDVKKL